jgi:hypothetical protein
MGPFRGVVLGGVLSAQQLRRPVPGVLGGLLCLGDDVAALAQQVLVDRGVFASRDAVCHRCSFRLSCVSDFLRPG